MTEKTEIQSWLPDEEEQTLFEVKLLKQNNIENGKPVFQITAKNILQFKGAVMRLENADNLFNDMKQCIEKALE